MQNSITLALDAMGGDKAPLQVVIGAANALDTIDKINFIFFGDESKIEPILLQYPHLNGVSEIIHADQVIGPEEKPSTALKKGANSSMRKAIDAVAAGKAQGAISAGNTGALMAISKFVLKTFPGIERPAIASLFPNRRGECVLLDLGANLECDANNLFQFALLGEGFARAVLGLENPKVALLNIGSEDLKGHEEIREAAALIRESGMPANFHGFVEGYDIANGTADVIVTDGFTGNVALKTAEGVGFFIKDMLKDAFTSNLRSRIGALLLKPSLSKFRTIIDSRNRGGGVFLGLNGVVVKCHGGSDEVGFQSAIRIAYSIVKSDLNHKIAEEIKLSSSLLHKTSAAEA